MRTLIIVTEGVDPLVLESEVAKGRLPWFARLMGKQRYRRMDCGPVPYEPSNLTTAFSGVNPGTHGCFSYWSMHSFGEQPRVLVNEDVKVPRVWHWPELADLKFGVVNVQLTHPPEPLNGFMVSYPMALSLNASYPRTLLADLHRRGIRYAHDVTLFYSGEAFDAFSREAWRVASAQLDTAMEIARTCDVMIVNLTLVDRVSHFLWYEMCEANPEHRPTVLRAYDFIDEACKRLQSFDPESTIVFSEIGFGPLRGFYSIDQELQSAGLQKLTADGLVDRGRSLAMETVQGSHGVMLSGDIGNDSEASPTEVDEVREFLTDLRFDDGTSVFEEVFHRDEIYSGPWRKLAPTLVVRPADPRRPPLGEGRWARHVRRTAQSGWHRDKGFVIVDSQHPWAESMDEARLQQIAPTIAHLLGRAWPTRCEMGSLLG